LFMETIYQILLCISLPSTDWCLLGPPTKFASHPLMWKLSGRANAQGGELAIFARQQLVLANKLSSWGREGHRSGYLGQPTWHTLSEAH
jgi:hypothetical protein